MLYLADNMAYFPYQVQDEPLFIIHHIDIIISVTGTNLLQSFREVCYNSLDIIYILNLFLLYSLILFLGTYSYGMSRQREHAKA